MRKKAIALSLAGFMLLSLGFVLEAAVRSPGSLKHLRYGIRMAENNLFSPRVLLRVKDKIGLTADQVTRIEKMHLAFQESAIKGHSDVKVMEVKFDAYLKNENLNRKKIEKMIRDIASLKTDMFVDRINFLLDLRSLLTPEQIKKLEELKIQFRRGVERRMRDKRSRRRQFER